MAIRINRNGETIYGQYSSGDVIINLPPNQENLLLEGGIATLLEEGELQIVLAGSGGSLVSAATTLSATGVSPGIALNGATRVSLTFGAPTGTVTAVTAQLENAANSAPLGTVYYPTGSPRWLDIPGGVTNVQIRATSWSGTGSIPLTVAG